MNTSPFNEYNFFMGTRAAFSCVEKPDRPADYEQGAIGSRYWYTNNGVYRYSDHWGRGVASCDWILDGNDQVCDLDAEGYKCGFAPWSAFELRRDFRLVVSASELENADGECYGMKYKYYTVTPEMMHDGRVYLGRHSCPFDHRYDMEIVIED